MERGNRRLQYLIVIALSSTSVTMGVSFAWATPMLPKFAANEVGFQLSNAELSWVVSVSSLGFIVGSCIARTTSDRCGRRPTIIGGAVPVFVGSLLLVYAWEVWMLSTARFLWGCGTGFMGGIALLYIAEVVDKDIRGRLSISNRFMMSFGCLLVITLGTYLSYSTVNYMQLALPVIVFCACWWIPESPYYLLKQGKVDAARKTLRMLGNIRDEEALEEKLSQMRSQVVVEMSKSDTIKEFLVGKRHRKAIWIVAALKIPQIFTGIHAIQNYLGLILLESKSGINVSTAIIVYGGCRLFLGIMSSILVDRIGRRPLLIYSFFGTTVVLASMAVFFGIQANHEIAFPYTLIPFIFILLSITISVIGYESVCYLIPAEVFPLNVKSIAMATTSVFGGINNFIAVKSFQNLKDWLGLSGVFVIYALASFFGVIVSYFLMPETKGKSLKEIQILLHGTVYDEEEKLNNIPVDNAQNGHK